MIGYWEYTNAEGRFTIDKSGPAPEPRKLADFGRDRHAWRAELDEAELVTRATAEAVLAALLANDLDCRPGKRPTLDTSRCRLPQTLAGWRWVRL